MNGVSFSLYGSTRLVVLLSCYPPSFWRLTLFSSYLESLVPEKVSRLLNNYDSIYQNLTIRFDIKLTAYSLVLLTECTTTRNTLN